MSVVTRSFWGTSAALLAMVIVARGSDPELKPLGEGEIVSKFNLPPGVTVRASGELPTPKKVETGLTPPDFPKATILEANVQPINLATALKLASARPIDVMVAAKQVELATLQYERTRLLWLPNVVVGADYFRHDGVLQNFQGAILKANRGSLMVGVGANAIFGLSDAIFAPLATAQELQARQASQQAVTNDVTLGVAESYFLLVQARGDFSAAEALVREGEELSRKTDDIAEGLAPPVEAARTRVELARRKQATITAKERWRTASAELSRLLRLDPLILLDPMEPANMAIPVIDGNAPIDDLIRLALTHRPELAANQSLVQATLQRLKQEKLRPLTPSILLRSTSTNPSGSLGFGVFGGGPNNRLGEFNTRFDYDVQILWELQNLGFGNRNRIRERNVEHEIATLELFRTQDRIAAEVSVAFAQLNAARDRLRIAEPAFAEAYDTFRKNSDALSQTRRIGNAVVLVSRPQEVVAALQALANSNSEYLAAVSDFNRVQFRLYRAIGHPATFIVEQVQPEVAPAASRAGPR